MSRGSRALTAAYLLASAWLGYAAINTWGRAPEWAVTLHVAASILFVLAILRELDLRDARRRHATLIAQQIREHEAHHGRPLNQTEAAEWFSLVGRIDLPGPDEPRSAA